MGQAKRRGSFEQRAQAAIDKIILDKLAKDKAELDRWNSLTPKEQVIEKTKKKKSAQMLAILQGFALGNGRL